jgi:pyruvate/2-oxoglutarate/acetoin dehydrogenase E1 component
VPGLRVLSPTSFGDPGGLLERTILDSEDPVLFVENKLLYLLTVNGELEDLDLQTITGQEVKERKQEHSPLYRLTVKGAPAPTLTLAAYGYMAELARQAMLKLAYEYEIFTELIIPTDLSAFDLHPSTPRLLAIEEGTRTLGWGAEIVARAVDVPGARLMTARRLAARDLPIPASGPLEALVLPGVHDIIQAARAAVME